MNPSVIDAIIATRLTPWFRILFRQQRRVLRSPSKRKAILCGRRAGKTVAAAAGLADALDVADFDEAVVYAARTRAIAKRLIWAKLHKVARDGGRKDWKFSESELTVTNSKGGFILICGMDKPAEIEKLRGIKLRRFIGDEPATYSAVLEPLYDEILEPACSDLDADIWLMGTPGPILAGFWFNASTQRDGFEDWEVHHWTMFDNPHMANPEGFLARVMKRKGWDLAEPTVQREYYGKWSPDDRAQVYRYVPSVNDHAGLPAGYDPQKWVHTVCVDFGVVDDFAWTVEASHPHSEQCYFVENGAGVGLLIDQMAEIVLRLTTAYNVHFLGGDPGGGGKSLIEQWNQRYAAKAGGMLMVAVEKTEKRANIDIFNSDLRTARLLYCMDACAELATEHTLLPWADAKRLKEHPSYPNNRADSALYTHRHHRAYLHSLPRAEPNTSRLAPDDPIRIAHEERQFQRDSDAEWWQDTDSH